MEQRSTHRSRATVDDLFADWIVELRRKGRSPNTVDGYERVYRRNIQPTLGTKQVTKVTMKMLTDLYGAHQKRGLAPRSVYQIHACLSSMFTQACRWGWRDSNPAQWAEPPSIPNTMPVVPTPEEVRALIDAAEQSRRPEYARAVLVADPHVFTDSIDGAEPWKPGSVSQFFSRLRERAGLGHLDFHYLRKFMETT